VGLMAHQQGAREDPGVLFVDKTTHVSI
jgi:hypothetical protein